MSHRDIELNEASAHLLSAYRILRKYNHDLQESVYDQMRLLQDELGLDDFGNPT